MVVRYMSVKNEKKKKNRIHIENDRHVSGKTGMYRDKKKKNQIHKSLVGYISDKTGMYRARQIHGEPK